MDARTCLAASRTLETDTRPGVGVVRQWALQGADGILADTQNDPERRMGAAGVSGWRGRLAGAGTMLPAGRSGDAARQPRESGCILVEREVSADPVVVGEVRGQDTSKMPLAEHDDMVQALTPQRANQALGEGVLPLAVRRGEDFLDAHALHAAPKLLTVDCIAVAEQIGRCRVVREGIDDLLGGPKGGGVLGHVEMDDPSTMVREHGENEEYAEACGRDREEVKGDKVADMIGEECPPSL